MSCSAHKSENVTSSDGVEMESKEDLERSPFCVEDNLKAFD